MFCENCGAELTGGGRFCPECGTAVTIKVQNQYKRELEMGGQAYAYMPEEKKAARTETESGTYKAEDTYSYTGSESRTAGTGDAAYMTGSESRMADSGNAAYMTGSESRMAGSGDAAGMAGYDASAWQTDNSYQQQVPDYGYSDDAIRAAQEELDKPSKAEEYKKTSTDWRDHVDSERFRQQNAQPFGGNEQHFSDQPFYTEPDRFAYDNRQADDLLRTYGMQYSDKSYIVAALLAFFLGGFGAHNFYLGYTKKAVIQLILSLLTLLTFGLTGLVAGIWGFVEFILLLVGTINTDGDGRPMKR